MQCLCLLFLVFKCYCCFHFSSPYMFLIKKGEFFTVAVFFVTFGTDLFCNSVPKLPHFSAGVLLFHEKALLRLKNGKIYVVIRYRQIGIWRRYRPTNLWKLPQKLLIVRHTLENDLKNEILSYIHTNNVSWTGKVWFTLFFK